jgi:hypothetical protein
MKKTDPGLQEIDAWDKWFRDAHTRRLASTTEFPDRHLLADERRRVDEIATAVVAQMKAQYLGDKTRGQTFALQLGGIRV